MDHRTEDFLNDKIQGYSDFDSQDLILASVKHQHSLLQSQLEAAERDLVRLSVDRRDGEIFVEQQIAAHEKQQRNIDRRLAELKDFHQAQVAIARLEPAFASSRSLREAAGYLQICSDIGRLERQSSESSTIAEAIDTANQFLSLTQTLANRHSSAEGAAPHLVDYVRHAASDFRRSVKDKAMQRLNAVLAKFLWPKPQTQLPEKVAHDFQDAFRDLIRLQLPEIEASESQAHIASAHRPTVLYPFEVMMKPLEARFHYHFSGDKPTNKPDKPQYYLAHALDILESHVQFFNLYVQPVLLSCFAASFLSQSACYIDSTAALISSVIPVVEAHTVALAPKLLSQPQLLSHLVHELMKFDTALREEWHYDYNGPVASDSSAEWQGLTHAVLSQDNIFDGWLKAEKELAMARYDSINADVSAASLDYDINEIGYSKPAKAATRLQDLLSAITAHYRPLRSLTMKLRFLIDIQIVLLDRFYHRLHSALEAYLSTTSTLGRAMQGSVPIDENLQGVMGLDRLCRIYGSAEWIERSLKTWSDDPFFLDLWDELQQRARAGGQISKNVTVSDIAKQTSASLMRQVDEIEVDSGSIFDETALAYNRLRIRTEEILQTRVCSSVRDAVQQYARSTSSWTGLTGSDDSLSSISPALGSLLHGIAPELTFIASSLSPNLYKKILRAWMETIETVILDRVVFRNVFTLQGARQLAIDLVGIEDAITSAAPNQSTGSARFAKAKEAIVLLTLSEHTSSSGKDSATPTLHEAEASLFASNDQAREVLDSLEIEHLTVQEARRILETRTELRSP